MLLDRKKVKIWQKWVFGAMAVIMAAFLVMIPISSSEGCGGASSALEQLTDDITKAEASTTADAKNPAHWKTLAQAYVMRANQQTQDSPEQTADWEKGAEAYRKATVLEAKANVPKATRVETLQDLAGVYSFLKQSDKALEAHLRITELTPKDPQAFFNMAYAATNAGNINMATLGFTKFLELDPKSPEAPAVKDWIKEHQQTPSPAKDKKQ